MKFVLKSVTASFVFIILVINFYNTDNRLSETEPLTTGKGLDGWSAQRSYPGRNISGDGYFRAFEEAKLRFEKTSKTGITDEWISIGPKNFAGRTIALALDPANPDILYAGSASGGLWKLTITGPGDNDYSWERIETGFPVLGVGAIAVDPRDPDVIYIGTGEVYGYQRKDGDGSWGSYWLRIRGNYGIGLLKTTDGGQTWTKSLDWTRNQERGIQRIVIDPVDPDKLFAGTTEGIYMSTDAGETWEHVHKVVMTVDIDINPDDPDIIFACCGNLDSKGNGIYRSTDGGYTWTKRTTGLPRTWSGKAQLDIYEADPDIIYADIADQYNRVGLYRSVSNGDYWELVAELHDLDLTPYQGYFSHFVRVNPVDVSKIFLAKVRYYYSEDGGISYSSIYEDGYIHPENPDIVAHGDIHEFINYPGNPDKFYIASDGGVNLTEDGGRTFRNLNNGYITTQFYPGFASSKTDSNFAVGGMQDNGTALYHGDPDNWQTWVTSGDGGYSAINEDDNDIIYTSSMYLRIFKSTNRFIDWSEWSYATPYQYSWPDGAMHPDETASFQAPFKLVTPTRMYAATNYIYRSDDGGSTWDDINFGMPLNGLPVVTMDVATTAQWALYAATAPYIPDNVRPQFFASFDSGRNWSNRTEGLPDRYIVDVIVSPHNEYVVYVTLSGFGTSHLFRTSDGGRTWEDIGQNLPDLPTNAVAVDPQDSTKIYVGNDLGMWASTDYGQTWFPFNEGLSEAVMIMDLSISESNRKLRAVTHGNGIFERSLLTPDDVITHIIDDTRIPDKFELMQNYPNPFNPSTNIKFTILSPSFVSLNIYNNRGQLVKNLISEQMPAGSHEIKWDGRNDQDFPVSSGVYIYRINADNFMSSKKMLLIR
ncbi:FlgD immunoglobulin-like domain containing protein [candidate division KSB1 bacterium]